MEQSTNPEIKLAYEFVQYTGKHVFLTGKAGTGKTTFLHHLKQISPKRMIVTAPTGVAAINAGGVTLHSFFQMPFTPYIPRDYISGGENIDTSGIIEGHWKLNREKINIIKSLDLLVIDEISMVRADVLDQVDAVLRRYKNRNKVFGGVQLLLIGDIHQLAPVVKDDEWDLLKRHYETIFFFSSKALQKADIVSIELKHIYRQSDKVFIEVLNKIRNNKLDDESRNILSKRYIPDFRPDSSEGYITLTTHNSQSREINDLEMSKLSGKPFEFHASVDGQFPEYSYPTDLVLKLKKDAQVMFVKNDSSRAKLYFNGKIGKITKIENQKVFVRCPGDDHEIEVEMQKWQNMRYTIDNETQDILEEEIGSFEQLPLRLAWAITIHKSQGLTFDKAIIDANAAFAYGQVYVALSRCKTLEGMVLSTPLSSGGIISNQKVDQFSRHVEQNQPGTEILSDSKKIYQRQLLTELFDFNSIRQKVFSGKKMIKEMELANSNEVLSQIDSIIDSFKSEVITHAEKFVVQLEKLALQSDDIETNAYLQERVSKGCNYFYEKLDKTISENVKFFQLVTDNKVVKNQLRKFREEINLIVNEKLSCLNASRNGFSVKVYTETRAKVAIEEVNTKNKTEQVSEVTPSSVKHPQLYEKLQNWRNKKAEELKVPNFMVFQVKVLAQLTELLPTSSSELLKIKGLGKKNIQKFGTELLEIIQNYIKQNNIEVKHVEIVHLPKAEKVQSKKLTFDFFMQGKSIEEIANERSMAISTIEGHIAQFVSTGELSIEKLVTNEKLALAKSYFIESQQFQLGAAKQALGDDFSYSELRYVLNHLKFIGEFKAKSADIE